MWVHQAGNPQPRGPWDPSPSSALRPREDLAHRGSQQLPVGTGFILGSRTERCSLLSESCRSPGKEAGFLSIVRSCQRLAGDSWMPLCESVVADIFANDGQENFSLKGSVHLHKERGGREVSESKLHGDRGVCAQGQDRGTAGGSRVTSG